MFDLRSVAGQRPAATNWSVLAAARFFLAFVVVSVHMHYVADSPAFEWVGLFGGKAAVVGFLVISGFSIAASLDREQNGFIWRRFFRIYPAYFIVLLACVVLQRWLGTYEAPGFTFVQSDMVQIVGNFLLLQSYLVQRIDYNAVVWTLSLEFSFYVLAFAIARRSDLFAVGLMTISWIFFLIPEGAFGAGSVAILNKANMVRYCWPFLAGYLLYRNWGSVPLVALGGAGTLTMLIAFWTPEPLSAATFLITLVAIFASARVRGSSLAMTYLGDLSYGIYLMHLPVFILIHAATGSENAWIYAAAVMIAAMLVERAVERPCQRAGRAWLRSRGTRKARIPVFS